MDCPCRSGLSDGSDLRSGMGQGGTRGVSPTSTNVKTHCPPRQGRSISSCGGAAWHLGGGALAPGVPRYLGICQAIHCTCTCSGLACTTCLYHLSTQRNRGTATVVYLLARAPAQPTLGPKHCNLKNLNLPPSFPRIASHRMAPHNTRISYLISGLLSCHCSTRPYHMQSSSGFGPSIGWLAPQYTLSLFANSPLPGESHLSPHTC